MTRPRRLWRRGLFMPDFSSRGLLVKIEGGGECERRVNFYRTAQNF